MMLFCNTTQPHSQAASDNLSVELMMKFVAMQLSEGGGELCANLSTLSINTIDKYWRIEMITTNSMRIISY